MYRLLRANLLARKARLALTVGAIALAVALVISTSSGYASLEKSVRVFITAYLGDADVKLTAPRGRPLPGSLIDEVRDDPEVYSAYGRFQAPSQIRKPGGEWLPNVSVLGIDPAVDTYVERLDLEQGEKLPSDDGNVIVLDQGAMRLLDASVGDIVEMPGPGGTVELEVIGIVHKPEVLTAFMQSAYVPLKVMQRLAAPEEPGALTSIIIEYETNVDGDAFLGRWSKLGVERGRSFSVQSVREQRDNIDRMLTGLTLLALLGGMTSLLAATFIVFGTQSMGVVERQRTLAMLRSIGATRGQIVGLVLAEGLVLALLGIAVGVPLGLGFTWILTSYYSNVFSAGLAVGWLGLVAAVVVMSISAVVASLLPAWRASKTSPLDAMRPAFQAGGSGAPWKIALVGLLLISFDFANLWTPIGLIFPEDLDRTIKFWFHFFIGLPCVMFGAFLVAPMLVWLVERLLSTPAAWLSQVEPRLLKQQLSSGIWRAAGTAAALMVGLAVLITMNTEGRSNVNGWQIPDDFPDVFFYNLNGISEEQFEVIAGSDEVLKKVDGTPEVAPMAYFNPTLGEGLVGIAGAQFQPNRTMFIAIDPRTTFDMLDLDFIDGDPEVAKQMLIDGVLATLDDGSQVAGLLDANGNLDPVGPGDAVPAERVATTEPGKCLLVTVEFQETKGLEIGDPFVLRRSTSDGLMGMFKTEPVEFRVVGVVNSPGIDVMVSQYDLGRAFEAESAASVFGSLRDAREIFGITNVSFVAANLQLGVDKTELVDKLNEQYGSSGLRVADIRQLKYEIQQTVRGLLLVASSVAWAAMLVASMGVTNTIMAAIRSRRYQLGVLRAIGLTRGELCRLVLAEAVLLGVVAAALGSVVGIILSINAGRTQWLAIGYDPPLEVAWDVLAMGVAAVMLVSLAAALWPAVGTARMSMLNLLKAGRDVG